MNAMAAIKRLLSTGGSSNVQPRLFQTEGHPWSSHACRFVGRWGIAILLLLTPFPTVAQMALQNMLASDTSAANRSRQMQSLQPQDYTFKEGDFRMLVAPSLAGQWNENINLAKTNVLDDFIITPAVQVTASYPWSERNLLFLDFNVGYNWYLKHPSFSSFQLDSSTGTGVSFDMAIKDFTLNLHDRMNYSQGVGQYGSAGNVGNGFVANTANGSVANTSSYGTFQNTAGLQGTWDLNQATLSLGYDHQNVLATTSEFSDVDHSSEMVSARAGLQIYPQWTPGVEATAAFTTYNQDTLNDNNAYTLGPYIAVHPDQFLTLTARGGYEVYRFQNTSQTIRTGNQSSWYAGLTLSSQPTEFIHLSLDAGREVQLGTVSDLLEDWYLRPKVTWTVIKGLELATFLFFERGNQGVGSTGSLPGYANGTFDWYGGGFSVQHEITSRLALSLTFQCTARASEMADQSYTQNLVALQLTYHPQIAK